MRVVILTEASKTIGFGHLARCTAIYEGFKEHDARPRLVVDVDDIGRELLSGPKLDILNWTTRQNIAPDLFDGVDIAIIDSYSATYRLYQCASELAKISVYLDDYKRLAYPKGVVVNGAVCANDLGYPELDGITYLLGNKYMTLRKEFWNVPERIVRDRVESIMIALGGSDPANITGQVLTFLSEFYPKMRRYVVLGAGFQDIQEITGMRDKRTQIFFNLSASNMKKVMLKSDLAISAGGQTLCELASIGVPTIAVATAENQLFSIKGWVKKQCIYYAGWWQDIGLVEGVLNGLQMLQSKKTRENLSYNSTRLVDGRGAIRLVERIAKMLNSQLRMKPKKS